MKRAILALACLAAVVTGSAAQAQKKLAVLLRGACGAPGDFHAHGFFQQDGPAVAAILSFIRSR